MRESVPFFTWGIVEKTNPRRVANSSGTIKLPMVTERDESIEILISKKERLRHRVDKNQRWKIATTFTRP